MYIPKSSEIKTIQQQNHRENKWRKLMESHETPKNEFARKLTTTLVFLHCRIKETVIRNPNVHHVYFIYRQNAYTERLMKALIKIFSSKGYTVAQLSPTKIKIIWD